jgi:hypothetical protein
MTGKTVRDPESGRLFPIRGWKTRETDPHGIQRGGVGDGFPPPVLLRRAWTRQAQLFCLTIMGAETKLF